MAHKLLSVPHLYSYELEHTVAMRTGSCCNWPLLPST